jgi:sulfur-oxidizing protein SoxY
MSEQAGPDRTRRLIIKGAVVGGLAGFGLVGGGLMRVQAADASKWPKDAFAQKTEADAIKAIYGKSAEESDKVRLDARKSPRTARSFRSRSAARSPT